MMNEAWRAAMVGTSPVERGHQKDQAALFWLWRWGWSTATTTDLAVSKSRGVVKRLVDRGLIEYYGTEGYRSKYYPARVTVLTKAGASLAGETHCGAPLVGHPPSLIDARTGSNLRLLHTSPDGCHLGKNRSTRSAWRPYRPRWPASVV